MRSLVIVMALVGHAFAQSANTQAEALFDQAKKLMAEGKTSEACKLFEASQKLDPVPTTQINLANCREKNGQIVTAWGLFVEVERKLRDKTDKPNEQLRTVATTRAAALAPRLSKLTIRVASPDVQMTITRDANEVDRTLWNVSLPIDGGKYRISASATGKQTWDTIVVVANEKDDKTVEVPTLKAPMPEPLAPKPKPPEPASVVVVPEQTPSIYRRSKLPIVIGVGAVALGGAALGVHLWAGGTYDDAKVEPDDAKQEQLWNSANTRRHIAQGLGIGAIAAAGIAIVWWIRDAPPRASESGGVGIVPLVSPTLAGISISRGF